MSIETKIDCETKKYLHLGRNRAMQGIRCVTVTISFVCHQKPQSLQPHQIYGSLVTNTPLNPRE
jgi:hypothetical protein